MTQNLDDVIKILSTLKNNSADSEKIKNALAILQENTLPSEYKDIFESSPNAIIIHEKNIIIQVNQAALKLYGYQSKSELIGKPAIETMVYKDDIDKVINIRNFLKHQSVASTEHVRLLHKNGTPIITETHISKLEIGNKLHIQIISKDIRRRVFLEEKALETKLLFESVFENSLDAIFIHDFNKITNVNHKFLNLFGYKTKDEIIGNSPIESIIHPDDHWIIEKERNHLKENDAIHIHDLRNLKQDGTIFHAEFFASVIDIKGKKHLQIAVRDITEIKETKEKAYIFNHLIENSFNEVYIIDALTLNLIEVNSIAANNLGYTVDEIKNFKPSDIVLGTSQDEILEMVNTVLNGESNELIFETIHKRKDGSQYPVESHLQKLELDYSTLISITVVDITKRKQKTLELQKSKEKYKNIVDTMIDIFVRVNHLAVIEMVSPSIKLLGYSASDINGKPVMNFYANPLHVDDFFNEVMEKGQIIDFETQLLTKNGATIDVLINGKLYIDEYGEYGIESIFKDITELKNQQRKLIENQSLLTTINENSPDIIIITDLDFNITYVNRIVHFTSQPIVGENVLNFALESDKKELLESLNIGVKGGKSTFEMELHGEDGVIIQNSVRISPIFENNKVKSLLITNTDITESKNQQLKIIENQNLLAAINENSPDVITIIDLDFNIIYANRTENYPRDFVIGTSILNFIQESDKPKQLKHLEAALRGEKTESELELYTGDGVLTQYSIRISPIKENNIVKSLLIINTDITDKRNIKKELQAQKERLTLATSASKMGVFDWNIKLDTLLWDDLMYETFGVNKKDYPNAFEVWSNSLHPNDVEKSQSEIDMALQGLKTFNSEFRIILPDQSIRYIQGLGKVLRDKDNEPYRMIGLNWDISKQKRNAIMTQGIADIQESFITAKSSTESFSKMLIIALEISDSETGFIGEVNYKNEVPFLTNVSNISNPSTIHSNQNSKANVDFSNQNILFDEVLKTGNTIISNTPIKNITNQDESITSLSNYMGIPFYYKEKMLGMIGLANKPQGFKQEDIDRLRPFLTTCSTLIKAQRDTLKKNEAEEKLVVMADIVANSNDAIISTNITGKVISWNTGAEKLLGYKAEEIIGLSVLKLRPKKYENIHNNLIKNVKNGKVINTFETVQVHKNGEYVNVDMSIFPLTGTEGNITGVSSILRDISERIEITKIKEEFTSNLEDKVNERTLDLEKAKKELAVSLEKEKVLNELKSKFVSTASHQFRTPLSVIQAGIGLLDLQRNDMSEKLQKSFDKTYQRISSQVLRMTNLMDEVLTLGNINNGHKKAIFKTVDLVKLCEFTVNTYNGIQKDKRQMTLTITGNQNEIKLDKDLIEHAVSNLISNSFKFSIGKGAPTLAIDFTKNQTQLRIIDYGIGIPEKDLTHFFDPFFRASNTEGISGTGLGTAIAKEYIELNNGTIEVLSELNVGTEFIITFKN
jgi:PAS domain S-box-containing protein